MAKKKADDPRVLELAEGLLSALESLRRQGGGTYPPTLRQLAESGGARADSGADEALQAAAKKPFSDKAVVAGKVGGKPTWDSHVYFKGDKQAENVVKAREIEPLARRLALVLESQRRLGGDAYPTTVGRLAELAEMKPSDNRFKPCIEHEAFKQQAVVAIKRKPYSESRALLRADADFGSPEVTATLIEEALDVSMGKGTEAFTVKQLSGKLDKTLQVAFAKAARRNIERSIIPPGIGWLNAGKTKAKENEYLLFFLRDIRPGISPRPAHDDDVARPAPEPARIPAAPSAPEAGDFGAAFRDAFRRLDRENRGTNFVRLLDMRRALPECTREQFDSGLRQLRIADEFTLNTHDGREAPLTAEEREAGVSEMGSLLTYVSRKE